MKALEISVGSNGEKIKFLCIVDGGEKLKFLGIIDGIQNGIAAVENKRGTPRRSLGCHVIQQLTCCVLN